MIRSKISIMAVLGFGICSVACNKSAATETQSAATKSSAKSAGFALASALQSPDLNSRAYDIRLERALKNAMISRALASAEDDQKAIVEKFDKCFPPKTASPAETAALGKEEPPKNCKNGDGDEFGDGEATVDSKGIVQFCESGRAKLWNPAEK